ncbi:hypothetical protein ACWD5V_24795 [Streptomyces sp. NPDC002523]
MGVGISVAVALGFLVCSFFFPGGSTTWQNGSTRTTDGNERTTAPILVVDGREDIGPGPGCRRVTLTTKTGT